MLGVGALAALIALTQVSAAEAVAPIHGAYTDTDTATGETVNFTVSSDGTAVTAFAVSGASGGTCPGDYQLQSDMPIDTSAGTFTFADASGSPVIFGTFQTRSTARVSSHRDDGAGCVVDSAWDATTHETPPIVTIDTGPSGPTNDSTPRFTFGPSGGALSFSCRLTPPVGEFASCPTPHTTSRLDEGSYTIEVLATDLQGNSSEPASQGFTIDVTPPAVTIGAHPPDVTNNPSPLFEVSVDENVQSLQCWMDGGAHMDCSSGQYTPPSPLMEQRSYTFHAQATDLAGTPGRANLTFQLDTERPIVTISGPSGVVGTATPTFSVSVETGEATECRVDGGSFVPCASQYTTPALGDGLHTLYARATDAAGNLGLADRQFRVEAAPPVAIITEGPAGVTRSATPTFRFASNEEGAFQCGVDGGLLMPCVPPYTTARLADGDHAFVVRATDLAGKSGDARRAFTVDTKPPPPPVVNPDKDGDGVGRGDCNDANPAIHPGALDVPGNGVDEDCDGHDARFPRLSSSVRSFFDYPPLRFTKLTIIRPFAGSRIELRCRGAGCFKHRLIAVRKSTDLLSVLRFVKDARLKRGAVVEVRITKPGYVGFVRRIAARRGNASPKISDLCLPVGSSPPRRRC